MASHGFCFSGGSAHLHQEVYFWTSHEVAGRHESHWGPIKDFLIPLSGNWAGKTHRVREISVYIYMAFSCGLSKMVYSRLPDFSQIELGLSKCASQERERTTKEQSSLRTTSQISHSLTLTHSIDDEPTRFT